jgi:ubiquinol-cytochrome c reductase cytochrome c subunit
MTNSDPMVGIPDSGMGADGRRRIAAVLGWALVLALAGVVLVLAPARGQEVTSGQPAAVGADLYERNCASCHGTTGQGTFRGPTLIGVGAASADYWLRSGRMPLPLRAPDQEATRGDPAFDDAEIRALVDHVAGFGGGPTIPDVDTTGADLAAGGELYRVNCASCHNWDGKGGALVNRGNAPPLHPVPNRQLAEAIRIGPGAMPQFSAEQLDAEELDNVIAYVDYLRTPRDAGGYGLAHWGPSTETVAAFVAMIVLVGITAWLGERRHG